MSEITKKDGGPLTEERLFMYEETEIIFLATLEDVKKYHYRLIENYSLDEWLADAENDYEKWAFTKFYGDLTYLNAG